MHILELKYDFYVRVIFCRMIKMIFHSDQSSLIIDIPIPIAWRRVIYQTCYDELAIYWLPKIKYVKSLLQHYL